MHEYESMVLKLNLGKSFCLVNQEKTLKILLIPFVNMEQDLKNAVADTCRSE